MRVPVDVEAMSFLFCDIEGSTRLWEQFPTEMSGALETHDELVLSAFRANDGEVFSAAGDGYGAAFVSLEQAARAARTIQRSLGAQNWPTSTPIMVRMGLHSGVAEYRDGAYFGPAVNRAARIMSSAHGGQTVVSATVNEALREGPVPLNDLGLHHLKDLDEPERIWQFGAGTFPPLRSARGTDVRLPESPTALVGRSAELGELMVLLPTVRGIAIIGPGGIGKTRVAVALASQVVDDYPDGVVFCDLGQISRSDEVPEVVATAVGVRQSPGRSMLGTLEEWYRAKRALLILDNCEQVTEGARELVDRLLMNCAELQVVLTSRASLGSEHALMYALKSIGGGAAHGLLVDRIRRHDPTFDETTHSVGLRELGKRLDGMPLAIELAAARCRGLSPAELVERIDQHPALLRDPSRDPRQQSVDAIIAGSYEALSINEQIVLARCSVFVGPFDLASAEAVVGHEPLEWFDVSDALVALVSAGLVQRSTAAAGYRMLAPVRQATLELVAAADPVRDRHRDHFVDLAERIGVGVESADEARWGALALAQLGDLREAWERCIRVEDVDGAARIVWGLYRLAFDALHIELMRWARETLELIDADDPAQDAARSRCLGTIAACAFHLNEFDLLHRSVAEIEGAENAAEEVRPTAYSVQALAYANQRDEAAAIGAMRKAIEAAGQVGDTWNLAMGHIFLRDFDTANRLCREMRNPSAWAWFHNYRGFTRTDEGRLMAAEDDFSQGEEYARLVGNTQALAVALNERGLVAGRAGTGTVRDEFGPIDQAIEIFQRTRTPLQLWNSLEIVAQALHRHDFLEAAAVLWAAIDQEGVTPASRGTRPSREERARVVEAFPSAPDRGMTMDVWLATAYAREMISLALEPTSVAPGGALR